MTTTTAILWGVALGSWISLLVTWTMSARAARKLHRAKDELLVSILADSEIIADWMDLPPDERSAWDDTGALNDIGGYVAYRTSRTGLDPT